MIILHWEQFKSLWGAGDAEPEFRIRWKEVPLSPGTIARVLSAISLGIALPYGEEYWRCLKAEKKGLVGIDTPQYVQERVYERRVHQI